MDRSETILNNAIELYKNLSYEMLTNDINEGNRLLKLCNYPQELKCLNCTIKEDIIKYIEKIEEKYGSLIILYNYIKAYHSTERKQTNCKDLNGYISFLTEIKKDFKQTNKFEDFCKLIAKIDLINKDKI